VLTPPGGIGPGGKGGVGYWSGRGATPETAVQLKGVTVSAMRIPRTTWDAITTARILTLDERVQQLAFDFINAVETELGVRLRVSQARRSIEEQNRIWQMGRDANGRKVGVTYTNVKGGMSAHNFGLAIDVVIYPKVNTAIPVSVAQIGERYGFEWGGRWSDPKDYPHFQMFWINGRGPR
jgi:D-alanyl-D-alanine dipeptidase